MGPQERGASLGVFGQSQQGTPSRHGCDPQGTDTASAALARSRLGRSTLGNFGPRLLRHRPLRYSVWRSAAGLHGDPLLRRWVALDSAAIGLGHSGTQQLGALSLCSKKVQSVITRCYESSVAGQHTSDFAKVVLRQSHCIVSELSQRLI